MTRGEELDRYVELAEWIRELSAPQTFGIRLDTDYRERFLRNYARIRELSRTSKQILETQLFPLLEKREALTEEETEDLFVFSGKLQDAVRIECVDVPLRIRVLERLKKEADRKGDEALLLRALDGIVETSYYRMVSLNRNPAGRKYFLQHREEGMAAAQQILKYLDKEQFAALSDYELREIVLINARYINALYEHAASPEPEEMIRGNMDAMKLALSLAEDPFYISRMSKYSWKNHTYRAMQGIAHMTEYCNEAGIDDETLQEINRYTRQMVALWKKDKVSYGALCSRETLYQSMYRNAYLAGEMAVEEYRKKILGLIDNADEEDFTHDGNMNMIFSQTEYMLTLDPGHLTEEQTKIIQRFYRNLVAYVHRMPKLGSLTFLLSYLQYAMEAFIETEDGDTFEDLALKLLAAINPQTYMHSLCVAQIAEVLARCLFEKSPKLFEQVPGYPDAGAVSSFLYRAGRLHDVGKLYMAETVITYNRRLFDEEEALMRELPRSSAELLAKFDSTRPFAETIRAHHQRYDKQGGYPMAEAVEGSKSPVCAWILGLANDMEGMTDDLRFDDVPKVSYEDFSAFAKKHAGTRYAPEIADLLTDKEIARELQVILSTGREDNYRKAYDTLKRGTEQRKESER